MVVEMLFPVLGQSLPTDHGYLLYSAASHLVPLLHDATSGIRMATVTGDYAGSGLLAINAYSRWRVRVPDTAIRDVLPLAGRALQIGEHSIRLGTPSVAMLIPAATLYSRTVTFKSSQPRPLGRVIDDPTRFLEVARRKLADLDITGEPTLPLITRGPRAGELRRRVVRVKGKRIVGFALQVEGLSAADSLKLQELGLGGRGRIGCGFFGPMRGEG